MTPLIAITLEQVASETLVAELRRRGGYRIIEDDGRGWTSPSKASLLAGFTSDWLSRILKRGEQPPGLEVDRAAGVGRIKAVRVTPEFLSWAQARKSQPQIIT